jgi:hypothetical protein
MLTESVSAKKFNDFFRLNFLSKRPSNGAWQTFDQHIDAGFVTKDTSDILAHSQPINIEYEQVYQELDEAIGKNREQQQQTVSIYYENAKAEIQTRLSNPQYNSIRLGITLRQPGSDRAEHFISSPNSDVIQLDITITASGSILLLNIDRRKNTQKKHGHFFTMLQ